MVVILWQYCVNEQNVVFCFPIRCKIFLGQSGQYRMIQNIPMITYMNSQLGNNINDIYKDRRHADS